MNISSNNLSHRSFVVNSLRTYWKILAIATFCSLLLGILSALIACLVGPSIQVFSSPDDRSYTLTELIGTDLSSLFSPLFETSSFKTEDLLTGLPIMLIIIGSLKCLSAIMQTYLWEITSEKIAKNLRIELLKTYLATHSYKRGTDKITTFENKLSSLITTEVRLIKEYLIHFYGSLPRELMQLVFMIITLLLLSTKLTFIFLACLLPALYIIKTLGRKLRQRTSDALSNNSKLTEWLQQRLLGIETIKLYHTENLESHKLSQLTDELYHKFLKAERVKARSGPLLEMLAIIALVAILFITLQQIQYGIISGSIATSFFATIAIITQSAQKIGRYFNQNKEGSAALGRINQAFQDASENQESEPATAVFSTKKSSHDLIYCKNLSVRYPKTNCFALSEFSYSFLQGKTYCIYGNSGSGKSTLLKTLVGIIKPNTGNVFYNPPLKNMSDIGYIPQSIHLAPSSIIKNISYPSFEIDILKAEKALQEVGLHNLINELPSGANTTVGYHSKSKLSGGQVQRIALARIFYYRFPLVLIDEGVSALDLKGESHFYSSLKKLQKENNMTVIIISHRLSSLEFADETIHIEKGKIATT